MFTPLHALSTDALNTLSSMLKDNANAAEISQRSLQMAVGITASTDVAAMLERCAAEGWTPAHVASIAAEIARARKNATSPEHLFDLVLSGPEIPGVPTRDTAAVTHELFEQAEEEVILVGYVVYHGKKLFERLYQKMIENPRLRVWFCMHIERKWKDTTHDFELVRKFADKFTREDWPWEPRPHVYYDPRCLSMDSTKRTSLHAKCVIVDRRVALVTSANFTEAAQARNIEAGIVIKHPPFVERLAEHFEGLRESCLKPVEGIGPLVGGA